MLRVLHVLLIAAVCGSGEPLTTKVSKFILSRLEANAQIRAEELAGQLPRVIGGSDPEQKPFVERRPSQWYPKESDTVLWSVTYSYQQHTGIRGNRIVVESYVVEEGKARLAGRAGRELDGVSLQAERVFHPKSGLYVLIHGVVMWASGHSIAGRAAVYEIDAAGVRLVWHRKAGNVVAFAHPHNSGFTVMYHDETRHQSNQTYNVIEVYLSEPAGLRRIVYQRY